MEDRFFVLLSDQAKVDYARIMKEADDCLLAGEADDEKIERLMRTRRLVRGLREPSRIKLDRTLVDELSGLLVCSEGSTFVYYSRLHSCNNLPPIALVYHICESTINLYALLYELLNNDSLMDYFKIPRTVFHSATESVWVQ
jgi:hypothetical protein